MFFAKVVALFAAVAFVAAAPVPMPLALARRGEQAVREFGVTPDFAHEAVVKRVVDLSSVESEVEEKRQIPDSNPTMAPNGVIVPYVNGKRSDETEEIKRQIPDSNPTMAPNGVVVPYSNGKRGEETEEIAPVVRPRGINTFPTSVAARSDGGEIVPF